MDEGAVRAELGWVKYGDTLCRFRFPIPLGDVIQFSTDRARGWELHMEDGGKLLIGSEVPSAWQFSALLVVAARKVWLG